MYLLLWVQDTCNFLYVVCRLCIAYLAKKVGFLTLDYLLYLNNRGIKVAHTGKGSVAVSEVDSPRGEPVHVPPLRQ